MTHPVSAHDNLADVLTGRPEAIRLLLDRGMHCVGCSVAPHETVAEACAAYGIPVDALLADLNGRPARARRTRRARGGASGGGANRTRR